MARPPYIEWRGTVRCPECFAVQGEAHHSLDSDGQPCAVATYIQQVEALVLAAREMLMTTADVAEPLRAALMPLGGMRR